MRRKTAKELGLINSVVPGNAENLSLAEGNLKKRKTESCDNFFPTR